MNTQTLPPLAQEAVDAGEILNNEVRAAMQKFAETVRNDKVHPIQAASVACTALGDVLASACVLALASDFPREAWIDSLIETLNEDIDRHYASFMKFRSVFQAARGER